MTLNRISSLLALSLLAPFAGAGTIYVNANVVGGNSQGTSWANAIPNSSGLQIAFSLAQPGDQIWVAGGSYLPHQAGLRTESFRLLADVEVYGGFNGTENSVGERQLGVTPSILTGDLAGNDGAGTISDNSYHVVRGGGAPASAVLDGFTVTAGNANGGGGNDRGAGIICTNSASPTIRNCHFIGNRCTFGGGAGYINNAGPSFTDTIFEDNMGGSFGGAFDLNNGNGTRYERCQFLGNRAARAGALEIFSTNGVIVSNCLFVGNTATGSSGGGGLWMGNGGNTVVTGCTIVGNSTPSQLNAGIRVQGGTPTIVNSVVYDNVGPGGTQTSANQIGGTTNVTYCVVEGGFAGVGNVAGDPQFTNAGTGDYSLGAGSSAIDAGNNAGAAAGVILDLNSQSRFVDDPLVPDTGAGGAPVIDIGAYEAQQLYTPVSYCFGDGSGTACPCGNAGAAGSGCGNSAFASGATASTSGFPSVSIDTLTFHATASSPSRPGMFFQGTMQQNGGLGSVFGDGLRCASGPVVRLELVFADGAGNASSSVGIANVGAVVAGATHTYQWWYRDALWGTCTGGFNVSNGLEIVWLP